MHGLVHLKSPRGHRGEDITCTVVLLVFRCEVIALSARPIEVRACVGVSPASALLQLYKLVVISSLKKTSCYSRSLCFIHTILP
jgi:hypothetical protein